MNLQYQISRDPQDYPARGENYQETLRRIHKMLAKYRIPFEEEVDDKRHIIRQSGEPINRYRPNCGKAVKVPAWKHYDTVQCHQMDDGRWQWLDTATGKVSTASFPYDPKRMERIEREAQKRINDRLRGPYRNTEM